MKKNNKFYNAYYKLSIVIDKILMNFDCYRRYKKIKYEKWVDNYKKQLERNAINAGEYYEMENNEYIVHFKSPNVAYYLPYYKEDLIQQTIISTANYYEIKSLNYICKEWKEGIVGKTIQGKCICDIGANIGNHSLYFALECSVAFEYIFEPIKDTYYILKRNISLNGLDEKTSLFNVGVGEKKAYSSISSYDKGNTGGTSLSLCENGNIPIISIDSLNIEREIALVKIDVEGFEVSVIKGMISILKKYHPYIMIEIQTENFEEISTILQELTYRYEKLDEYNYLFYVN